MKNRDNMFGLLIKKQWRLYFYWG